MADMWQHSQPWSRLPHTLPTRASSIALLRQGPTFQSAAASERRGQFCTAVGHLCGPRWQPRLEMFAWSLAMDTDTGLYSCVARDPDLTFCSSMGWDFIMALDGSDGYSQKAIPPQPCSSIPSLFIRPKLFSFSPICPLLHTCTL